MADAGEIKRLLAEQAQRVCEHLLPAGRKDGKTWAVGSVHGDSGQSLRVELAGAKRGIWADFANPDDSGDLLDLWGAVKSISVSEAFQEARDWLGIAPPNLSRAKVREWTAPNPPKRLDAQTRAMDYLTEDRNLPEEAVRAYRIADEGGRLAFPFLDPENALVMVKARDPQDGAKPVPTAAGCKPILFGWQAIPADARSVTITEGELDAPSMWAYGRPALSVPFGGGSGNKQTQWIENEYENLQRFEVIYLALDDDEVGEDAAQEIAKRLGQHRCKRVILPRKDGNQCLMDGVGQEEIDAAYAKAEIYRPANLAPASAYADAAVRLFWPQPGDHQGYETPYAKLSGKLMFRPGEISLWSGDTGHGKSQILSDCTVDWVKQGSRVCVASLEMAPAQSIKRMIKQTVGADRPPEPTIRYAVDWLDQGLIFYSLVGKDSLDNLLEAFDYARACYGCDQFIIDSLMRLGIAGDDYNSQETAVYKLVDWAITSGCHVHLVAHARKGQKDRGAPESADIKGAMEIGANAFNILTVWRDTKREDDIRKAKTPEEKDKSASMPGVMLNVAKQRNGDFEGKVGLWFDQECYQYRCAPSDFARCYLDKSTLMGLRKAGENGA